MSEDLKLMIAVLIKNTVCTIAFILLAIAFNKWWLCLFGILFITTVEKNNERKGEIKKC